MSCGMIVVPARGGVWCMDRACQS